MFRSEKLRRAVAELPCQWCGREGETQASHSNQGRDGKGMSLKAHDYRIAALCVACHAAVDSGNKMSKADRLELWEFAHRKTIGELFERGRIVVV